MCAEFWSVSVYMDNDLIKAFYAPFLLQDLKFELF